MLVERSGGSWNAFLEACGALLEACGALLEACGALRRLVERSGGSWSVLEAIAMEAR